MNFIQVYKSIKETGGASYNLHTGMLNPIDGYMVPLKDESVITRIPETYEQFRASVQSYLAENNRLSTFFTDNDIYYLGFWVQKDSFYIDICEHLLNFNDAYQAGFDRQQIAIYDCKKKRDITIIYSPSH